MWQWQNMQQKNDGGRLFCSTLSAIHTDKLRAGLEGNVQCWQKWTGETSLGGIVRGMMSRGNVLHLCVTNLRRIGTWSSQRSLLRLVPNILLALLYACKHWHDDFMSFVSMTPRSFSAVYFPVHYWTFAFVSHETIWTVLTEPAEVVDCLHCYLQLPFCDVSKLQKPV